MRHEHAILSTEEECKHMASVIKELHITQLPFPLVASELVRSDLAFYPDETPDDLSRTISLLRKLVRDDRLAGIAPARGTAGTCDLEEARIIAQRLRQARYGVDDRGILATEAEVKYGFTNKSIYNWHNAGWIRINSIDGGNRLFNEGDVAVARFLADLIGHRAGKAVFPYRVPPGRLPSK